MMQVRAVVKFREGVTPDQARDALANLEEILPAHIETRRPSVVDDDPSDEVLLKVQEWGSKIAETGDAPNWRGLLEYMEANWPEYGVVRRRPATDDEDGLPCASLVRAEAWEFVTGGWSGCEAIIGAFYENSLAHACLWESTHRGGLHVLVLRA
jgi:hypothetical protein